MSEEQQVRLNVHTEKMGTSYANADRKSVV